MHNFCGTFQDPAQLKYGILFCSAASYLVDLPAFGDLRSAWRVITPGLSVLSVPPVVVSQPAWKVWGALNNPLRCYRKGKRKCSCNRLCISLEREDVLVVPDEGQEQEQASSMEALYAFAIALLYRVS